MFQRRQRHDAFLGGFVEAHFARAHARAHHEDAIRDSEDFGQIAGNDQNRQSFAHEFAHQRIDLGLGADIDAARGFIDDQHARLRREPFRQHDLLLIATAQQTHELLDRRRLDLEAADIAVDHARFLYRANHVGLRQAPEPELRQRQIAPHRHAENQTLILAILRHEADVELHRIAGLADLHGLAFERHAAVLGRRRAENAHRDFGSSRADQICEAHDLTASQREGHVAITLVVA